MANKRTNPKDETQEIVAAKKPKGPLGTPQSEESEENRTGQGQGQEKDQAKEQEQGQGPPLTGERNESQPILIGDHSKPCALPQEQEKEQGQGPSLTGQRNEPQPQIIADLSKLCALPQEQEQGQGSPLTGERNESQPILIGDHSKPCALPQEQEQGQGPSLSDQRNEPQPALIADLSKPCALPQEQEQGQGHSLTGQRNEPQPELIADLSKPCALPQELKQEQEQGQGPPLTDEINEPQPELISDLSKPCALPCLLTGIRYKDIRTISVDTLARLIRGEFDEQLGTGGTFQILDCRYPYEFHGGHIRGARNIFTFYQLKRAFPIPRPKEEPEGGRRIYIFHCEFSSVRGPRLLGCLYNRDRLKHIADYPTMDYPELYLLHKGYKQFYRKHPDLCQPRDYLPMSSQGYEAELRRYQNIEQRQMGDRQSATPPIKLPSSMMSPGTEAELRLYRNNNCQLRLYRIQAESPPKPGSTRGHYTTRGDDKKDESPGASNGL